MKKNWKNQYFMWGLTALITIILAFCFYYLMFMGQNLIQKMQFLLRIIMPVVDGLAIAYIASPILNTIEHKIIFPLCDRLKIDIKKGKNRRRLRGLSIVLTLAFILLILYAFFSIVIPQLIRSIQSIIFQFPIYVYNLTVLVEKLLSDNPEVEQYVENLLNSYSSDIAGWLNRSIVPQINVLIKSISLSLIGILKSLYNLVIGFIISVYVLASKERFASQTKKMCYAFFSRSTSNMIIKEFRFVHRTFIGFLSGKIVDSFIIGVLCFVGTSLLKMPYSLLISVIVGVTNIIPFFGPYIGAIPSALLILMVNPAKCLYFIIFILILQQIDGNIIGPKILGNSTGLSGFWVIFSITLFGGVWGVLGMIVGIPIFAVIYAAVSSVINKKLTKKQLPTDTGKYKELDYIDENDKFVSLNQEENETVLLTDTSSSSKDYKEESSSDHKE
ncbi:MAG: AI-2E family transporter [Lachnospiraceae bacterium]